MKQDEPEQRVHSAGAYLDKDVPASDHPRHRFRLMSRRLSLDRIEAGVGKGRLDTIKDPEEGRRVCDVNGNCLAGAAGEESNDSSISIDDDGAGIAGGRECAVLVAVWVDGQLHGRLVDPVLEVFPDKRHNAASTTDGHTGAVTVLDNNATWFAVRIEHCRMVQLVFLDDVPKLQEAATRVFEGAAGFEVREHLRHEVVDRNISTWV